MYFHPYLLLEPVFAVHILDSTIVSTEAEKLFPQLQHSQILHHIPEKTFCDDCESESEDESESEKKFFFDFCTVRSFIMYLRKLFMMMMKMKVTMKVKVNRSSPSIFVPSDPLSCTWDNSVGESESEHKNFPLNFSIEIV